MLDRQRQQQEVKLAIDQCLGQRLANAQIKTALLIPHQRQQSRQDIGRKRRNNAEAKAADQHLLMVMGQVIQIADRLQNGFHALQYFLARIAQLNALLAALKQF